MDANQQELYKKIGARIKEARLANHMSQAQLAEKANVSLPHISKIENGKTTILLTTFIRLIEALQVSSDVLLRSDIPEVKFLYQNEFAELTKGCSPSELDSILKIVKEVMQTVHQAKADETY